MEVKCSCHQTRRCSGRGDLTDRASFLSEGECAPVCRPLWPYAVLIGIPAAAFILPDLFGGHLVMTGDNLQQNYPLHVLVGSMLRHGELPFWNQYLFSGTPLLAGFNAGAFYPLVGLFVILPDRVAWIATEVILFSLIGVGMYLFLRALALSTAACVLAAAHLHRSREWC